MKAPQAAWMCCEQREHLMLFMLREQNRVPPAGSDALVRSTSCHPVLILHRNVDQETVKHHPRLLCQACLQPLPTTSSLPPPSSSNAMVTDKAHQLNQRGLCSPPSSP